MLIGQNSSSFRWQKNAWFSKQSGAGANIAVIPTAAVERIEILTDGASAIYGGDAAAGVVNVILKKDFDGVTIRGGTTEPDLPGGKEDNFSVVVGGSGDKSSFVFSYEHQKETLSTGKTEITLNHQELNLIMQIG